MTTDTDALIATVREALKQTSRVLRVEPGELEVNALAALDSLAAELERAREAINAECSRADDAVAELERVKEENSRLNSEHWKDAERTAMDQEIQRVKVERDDLLVKAGYLGGQSIAREEKLQADTDKALSALREIADRRTKQWPAPVVAFAEVCEIARAAIQEIEGEQT